MTLAVIKELTSAGEPMMSRNESGTAVAGGLEAEARAALLEAEGKGRFESLKVLWTVHSWLLALGSEAEDDRAATVTSLMTRSGST